MDEMRHLRICEWRILHKHDIFLASTEQVELPGLPARPSKEPRRTRTGERWFPTVGYLTLQSRDQLPSSCISCRASEFNMNDNQSGCISLHQIWILIESWVPRHFFQFKLKLSLAFWYSWYTDHFDSICYQPLCWRWCFSIIMSHTCYKWALLHYDVLITDYSDHSLLHCSLNISPSCWKMRPFWFFLETEYQTLATESTSCLPAL